MLQLNSTTLGLLGDIHIGVNENQENFINYMTKSLDFHLEKMAGLDVVFLGDIFHTRKHVTQVSLSYLKNVFEDLLKKYSVRPIFICGNHDTYWKSSNELSTVKFLLNSYNVVVDDCETIGYNGKLYATL